LDLYEVFAPMEPVLVTSSCSRAFFVAGSLVDLYTAVLYEVFAPLEPAPGHGCLLGGAFAVVGSLVALCNAASMRSSRPWNLLWYSIVVAGCIGSLEYRGLPACSGFSGAPSWFFVLAFVVGFSLCCIGTLPSRYRYLNVLKLSCSWVAICSLPAWTGGPRRVEPGSGGLSRQQLRGPRCDRVGSRRRLAG